MTGSSGRTGLDDATVRKAREGDERAFRDLARQARPLVRRWALARTGDPDAAEDVAQRVLLRLHRHLEGFEGRASFTTWLYRVTANAAADVAGERDRRSDHLAELAERRDSGGEAAEERGGAPEDRIHARRLTELVRTYVDELSDRQREAFDLMELQGLSAAEAADRMGVSPATARVHLHRARRTVRTRILELHPDLAEGYGA